MKELVMGFLSDLFKGKPSPKSFPYDMVLVCGGTFMMGSNKADDEEPKHRVTISDFYIGKYLVTQREWQYIMGNNPSYFKGNSLPLEQITWQMANDFILKLNQKTGFCFRLPTEAEWEFAARGGNNSNQYDFPGSDDIEEVGWYEYNSEKKTHPIGLKKPNELGIFDMCGNVWEWCSDWYGENYYADSPQNNPKGPITGKLRVYRGGSMNSYDGDCTVSSRYQSDWMDKGLLVGIRLAHSQFSS